MEYAGAARSGGEGVGLAVATFLAAAARSEAESAEFAVAAGKVRRLQ